MNTDKSVKHYTETTGLCNEILESLGQCNNRVTDAQITYEADVKKCPRYHDGTPRKTWDQLGALEKHSWAAHLKQKNFN